jgi:hypothetical protein
MTPAHTVFILGAGASNRFGLPTGSGLSATIAEMLRFRFVHGQLQAGDGQMVNLIRQQRGEVDVYARAAVQLAEALPTTLSVDDCLRSFDHDPRIVALGKWAIAAAIARAERQSSGLVALDGEPEARQQALIALDTSWLADIFRRIRTTVRFNDRPSLFEGVAIINFNYDRCIEQYLFHAVQRAFGVPAGDAAEVMQSLHIVHPYGQIGFLPWQSRRPVHQFASRTLDVVTLAGEIRTYTEQAADATAEEVSEIVASARKLVFLGFGYHPQNVSILARSGPDRKLEVLGTAYEQSHGSQGDIRRLLGKHLHVRADAPVLEDATCDNFMISWGRPILEQG